MAYQPKDMTGSLFRNEQRESDSHPNAKGSALIDGVEYWVDAWTNETKDGQKYQALKFKRKDKQPQARPQRPKDERYRAGAPATSFDDTPF